MNKSNTVKKYMIFLLSAIVLIILDQISKIIAIDRLKNQASFKIIKDVFEFEYVENRGSAFGMLGGQRTFFIILTLIVIPLIGFVIYKIEKAMANIDRADVSMKKTATKFLWLQWVCVFLISGALGNFIDRLFRHFVVDFIYFKLIDFPVFNIADCYVTVATGIIIVLILILKEEEFDMITGKSGKENPSKVDGGSNDIQ